LRKKVGIGFLLFAMRQRKCIAQKSGYRFFAFRDATEKMHCEKSGAGFLRLAQSAQRFARSALLRNEPGVGYRLVG